LIFLVFNATFSNISAISWRPVLVVKEAGVPGETLQQYEHYHQRGIIIRNYHKIYAGTFY
jgi:hypothetical protein